MAHLHREPYLTLAGLTETSALIAWGAFFFDVKGEEMDGRFKIIEDKDLKFLNPPRKTIIGESSDWYGPAKLLVWEKEGGGRPVEVSVDPKPGEKLNHAWVTGLKPDTSYRYRLLVEVRTGKLDGGAQADNVAWSATPHFLLCEFKAGKMHVTPYGELKNGQLQPLENVIDTKGKKVAFPLAISGG